MAQVGVFSPSELTLIVSKPSKGISHSITGFTEGSSLTLSPSGDRGSAVYGMKGDSGFVVSAVKAYTCELSLMTTSHSNDILAELLRLGTEEIDPLFTVTILDGSGQTAIVDNNAAILTEGDYAFSDTIEARSWSINLPTPEGRIGGNGRFSAATQADYEGLGGTVDARWTAE